MSIVAVKITNGCVGIAADSQTTYGDTGIMRRQSIADDKLWATSGGVVIGFVGTSALGSILRRWSVRETPDDATEAGITAWVDDFQSWRRTTYEDAGGIDDLSFILAYQGTAWVIDGYSVSRIPDAEPNGGYMAIGSGMGVAIGAMAYGADPFTAVSIACDHVDMCGGNVVHARMIPDGTVHGDIECLPVKVSSENVTPERIHEVREIDHGTFNGRRYVTQCAGDARNDHDDFEIHPLPAEEVRG